MSELKELTPIKALRFLTGIIETSTIMQVLFSINLIARYLDNDDNLEKEFLLEQFKKIGIKLILDKHENE